MGPDDVFVDIASCSSPFADIVERLDNCIAYRQDLDFPPGVNGRTIGGSAEHLPIADGFFSRMTLHCSFEHFEGDADIGFVKEAGRVLRPGGAACILPLYVSEIFHNLTDPGDRKTATLLRRRGGRGRGTRLAEPLRPLL